VFGDQIGAGAKNVALFISSVLNQLVDALPQTNAFYTS
jgi:hypothetical protein